MQIVYIAIAVIMEQLLVYVMNASLVMLMIIQLLEDVITFLLLIVKAFGMVLRIRHYALHVLQDISEIVDILNVFFALLQIVQHVKLTMVAYVLFAKMAIMGIIVNQIALYIVLLVVSLHLRVRLVIKDIVALIVLSLTAMSTTAIWDALCLMFVIHVMLVILAQLAVRF
jgi:hypothetical protein